VLKSLLCFVCFLPLPGALLGQSCVPAVQFEPTIKAPIHNVTFTNDAVFPPEKEAEIAQALRDKTVAPGSLDKTMSSIAEEAAERARAAYQDLGYFKARVDGKAVSVATRPPQYDIMIQIRSVGKQYRLGDLNILHAPSFPTQQLRDQFPIQRGEIFSREKIAVGLEALRRLYGSEGYLNYTSVPETEFDNENAIANLTMDTDEGTQFHLRGVEVLGVDTETKDRMLSELDLKPGDLFNSEVWERSFQKFDGLARDPKTVDRKLDEQNGLVDVVLDFRQPRPCRVLYSGPPSLLRPSTK